MIWLGFLFYWQSLEFLVYSRYQFCWMYNGKDFLPFSRLPLYLMDSFHCWQVPFNFIRSHLSTIGLIFWVIKLDFFFSVLHNRIAVQPGWPQICRSSVSILEHRDYRHVCHSWLGLYFMFTKLESPPGPCCLHVPESTPAERMLFGDRGIPLWSWVCIPGLWPTPNLLPFPTFFPSVSESPGGAQPIGLWPSDMALAIGNTHSTHTDTQGYRHAIAKTLRDIVISAQIHRRRSTLAWTHTDTQSEDCDKTHRIILPYLEELAQISPEAQSHGCSSPVYKMMCLHPARTVLLIYLFIARFWLLNPWPNANPV